MHVRMLVPTAATPEALVAALWDRTGRAARLVRARMAHAAAWLRGRTPEQYLWVFMALVLLGYLAVLFTASTATGRGGR